MFCFSSLFTPLTSVPFFVLFFFQVDFSFHQTAIKCLWSLFIQRGNKHVWIVYILFDSLKIQPNSFASHFLLLSEPKRVQDV